MKFLLFYSPLASEPCKNLDISKVAYWITCDHWFAGKKRTPGSSIFLQKIKIFDTLKFSVIPNLNAMGNEIKKPRPFFWLVLRLWRPTRVRFLI